MATRAWGATEVGIRLSSLLADAEVTASDTSGNLKEPIDDALRLMGYAEADLPTAEPGDAAAFLAYVKYTVLSLILDRISDRFNLSTGGDRYELRQVVENVEKALARAAAAVSIDTEETYRIDLDYLGSSRSPLRDIIV